jgi:hypothetical protein
VVTQTKHYGIQIYKWNNNEKNNIQTHFTYWLFLTYPLPLYSRCPDRYQHTLFSCSFLLLAGWWMPNFYMYFLPPWESQNIRTLCQWLNDKENPQDVWLFELNFEEHWDTAFLIHKTRTVPGNPGSMGSLKLSVILKISAFCPCSVFYLFRTILTDSISYFPKQH